MDKCKHKRLNDVFIYLIACLILTPDTLAVVVKLVLFSILS